MAGRLDQYDDFIERSRQTMERKKPRRRGEDGGEVRRSLDTAKPDMLLTRSREDRTMLDIFYTKRMPDGSSRNVRRRVVVPGNRMTSYPRRTHIEVVDVNSMTRKVFRRDRIRDIKPSGRRFPKNPDVVGFRS